jgi:predicted negative regulator of RcsB-dependent stress response
MSPKAKTTIIVALVAIVGVGAYVGIRYYQLVKAYNTTIAPDEAAKVVEEKTNSVQDDDIIADDTTANADSNKGTSAN